MRREGTKTGAVRAIASWPGIALVLIVALSVGCRGTDKVATTDARVAAARLKTPVSIESFAALDLDGRRVELSALRGHVAIVNIWATWCAPCRRELPMLTALQEKYRDQVRVLGILQDNVSDDFARKFVAQAKLNFPTIRSSFEIEGRLPAVMVIPMTHVIDQKGMLVSSFAGECDPAELEKEIVRLTSR